MCVDKCNMMIDPAFDQFINFFQGFLHCAAEKWYAKHRRGPVAIDCKQPGRCILPAEFCGFFTAQPNQLVLIISIRENFFHCCRDFLWRGGIKKFCDIFSQFTER